MPVIREETLYPGGAYRVPLQDGATASIVMEWLRNAQKFSAEPVRVTGTERLTLTAVRTLTDAEAAKERLDALTASMQAAVKDGKPTPAATVQEWLAALTSK